MCIPKERDGWKSHQQIPEQQRAITATHYCPVSQPGVHSINKSHAMDSLVHKPSPSDTPWLQGTEKTSLRPPTPEK